MNKKLQVFVSSTYDDLREERQAAVQAIVEEGHIPAGMELFKAGKSQMQTIHNWIDESDVFMLILGGRYGSIEEESGLSYTELEYKYAISKGMPVFAIVLKDSFLFTKAASCGKSAVFETDNLTKYETFKKYVLTNIVKFVSNIYQIPTIINSHLNEILNNSNYNLIGWIRSDQINNSNECSYDDKFHQYLQELYSSLKQLLLDALTYRDDNNNFKDNWENLAIKYYRLHAFCQVNNILLEKYENEIEKIYSYWDQAVSIIIKVQNKQNNESCHDDIVNLQNILQSWHDLLAKML